MSVPILSCLLPNLNPMPTGGIVAHLMKPIDPETLHLTMRRLVREGETDVLLVDDDPDAVRLLQVILTDQPYSYKFQRAYNGRQALDSMERVVPDVVFMDLVMPDLGGEEAIAEMRANPRLRNLPVVLVSARDPTENPLVLTTPVSALCSEPLGMAQGCRLLKAMLDVLTPQYPLN